MRAEQTEGRADGRAWSRKKAESRKQMIASAKVFGSLHLFSIGNYFHRSLLPESNIKQKIIIEIFL